MPQETDKRAELLKALKQQGTLRQAELKAMAKKKQVVTK